MTMTNSNLIGLYVIGTSPSYRELAAGFAAIPQEVREDILAHFEEEAKAKKLPRRLWGFVKAGLLGYLEQAVNRWDSLPQDTKDWIASLAHNQVPVNS